jgi:hypothetical protein
VSHQIKDADMFIAYENNVVTYMKNSYWENSTHTDYIDERNTPNFDLYADQYFSICEQTLDDQEQELK